MPAFHREIITDGAPANKHVYSQGIRVGSMMFITSQIGINPVTKELVQGGIQKELKQAFKNIKNIIMEGGGLFEDLVMVRLITKDLGEFEQMDLMYTEVVSELKVKPARTVLENELLSKARVEVEALAILSPREN